jgi:hypothetical protein
LSPRGFFKLTNNLDIVTKILNRSRTFQWESRGLVVIMTPNQTTKPNQNKTTHIGETPRKFKTRVLDSRVEHLPYLHNQQLKPDQLTIIHPEQLVIDHSNTCSSIPITLRKGTRPSIPRGLLSGCRYLNNRQFNRKWTNATSHSTTENFDSETNEFVVFLGGIAVANISTNGKKGLVR